MHWPNFLLVLDLVRRRESPESSGFPSVFETQACTQSFAKVAIQPYPGASGRKRSHPKALGHEYKSALWWRWFEVTKQCPKQSRKISSAFFIRFWKALWFKSFFSQFVSRQVADSKQHLVNDLLWVSRKRSQHEIDLCSTNPSTSRN